MRTTKYPVGADGAAVKLPLMLFTPGVVVTLAANEPCRQAQLKAQNEYAAAVAQCHVPEICGHIVDPVAQARCFDRVLEAHRACIKAAQDRLDAANRAAEECYGKNKTIYEDCLAGK